MEILLAAAVGCTDYYDMVARVRRAEDLSPSQRVDIVSIYKEYYRDIEGMSCNWDEND